MKLTVLILVFNEAKTVLQAIEDARKIPVDSKEIIIIDNCSTDGARELLEGINDTSIRIIFQEKNLGAGNSIKVGLREAKGEFIYVHHSDLEYDYRFAVNMLNVAEKNNHDAVFGSRIANKKYSTVSLIRERPEYLATIIATFLVNHWYGRNFTDIIGSRLYRTEVIRRIPPTSNGMGAEFEHVSKMCKAGLKIGEIPIGYKPRTNRNDKKIKSYNMLNAFFYLFKVRYFENALPAAEQGAKDEAIN